MPGLLNYAKNYASSIDKNLFFSMSHILKTRILQNKKRYLKILNSIFLSVQTTCFSPTTQALVSSTEPNSVRLELPASKYRLPEISLVSSPHLQSGVVRNPRWRVPAQVRKQFLFTVLFCQFSFSFSYFKFWSYSNSSYSS